MREKCFAIQNIQKHEIQMIKTAAAVAAATAAANMNGKELSVYV